MENYEEIKENRLFVIDTENTNDYSFINQYNLNSKDNIVLFFSDKSKNITIDTLDCLLNCNASIKTERVLVGGKNALDFQIVAFVTAKVIQNAYDKIYIVSNDTGFIYAIDYINKSYNANVELKCTKEKIKHTKIDNSEKEISSTSILTIDEETELICRKVIPTISDRKIVFVKRCMKECKEHITFHRCLITSFGEGNGEKLYSKLIELKNFKGELVK